MQGETPSGGIHDHPHPARRRDPLIVDALTELLTSSGYSVDTADTQTRAIELATGAGSAGTYQLVLLDVTLREGNGFAVCAAVKETSPDTPVIFLTASDDEFNTVTGLTMGADDYVAKPFRPRELLARIAATIRRSQPSRRIVSLGDIRIDTDRAYVERKGVELTLSALEYRLLLLFATNPGKLVSRDMIRDACGIARAPTSRRTRSPSTSSDSATRSRMTRAAPSSSKPSAALATRRRDSPC